MRSLIMYRCHAYPSVCADRIALLSLHNPGIPILGLYGGSRESFVAMRTAVGNTIEEWYAPGKCAKWNWQHGDLAVRAWFRAQGHRIAFDRLYLVEWDLLLLASMEQLYSHVPSLGIAVTARCPLTEVADDYGWTTDAQHRREWEELVNTVTIMYGYADRPFASLGPGTCYSRAFLERYSEAHIPELSSDELRVPLFAQCFDIPVCDTHFRASWNNPEELEMFNCVGAEVPLDVIRREAAKPDGRRAFHPYRQPFLP